MVYASNYGRLTNVQIDGSEYGGAVSRNTVQPKGAAALTSGEQLRLMSLVGDLSDPLQINPITSLEDSRQMLGLRPASGTRPNWLAGTGRTPQAEIEGAQYPPGLTSDDLGYGTGQ